MDTQFSFKELYDVSIKSTYDMEINGKRIQKGEVIGFFNKIQLSNFQEVVQEVAARGGYGNRGHVFWTTVKEINFIFSQGIFSKTQLALMLNSKLATMAEETLYVQQREEKETNEDGKFELKFIPSKNLFIYKENGDKVQEYTIEDKTITIQEENSEYKNFVVDYEFLYDNSAEKFEIGNQLYKGFVSMEARTRIKDDVTGKVHTGIFKIPKMRIMSNFSMRLGNQANPYVATLQAIGYPEGSRESKVMEFYLLNNDIDSDM